MFSKFFIDSPSLGVNLHRDFANQFKDILFRETREFHLCLKALFAKFLFDFFLYFYVLKNLEIRVSLR